MEIPLSPTAYAAMLVVIAFIHRMSAGYVHAAGIAHYESPQTQTLRLFDALHERTPDLSHLNYSKNYLYLAFAVPLIASDVNKAAFLWDFVGYFSVVLLIRSATMASTVLPKNPACETPAKIDAFHGTVGGVCYDKMFSGHFAFSIVFTYLLFKHRVMQTTPANVFALVCFNVLNAYVLIASRSHYTMDVLVSGVITSLLLYSGIKFTLQS